MIYLDNAATTAVKPDEVYQACDHALRSCSGNPGRSGHALSMAAARIVSDARIACARFFHAQDASEICFTLNATSALNTAIYGTVQPGAHVITSSLEHNSVSRPLEHLRTKGAEVTVLNASLNDGIDPEEVRKAIKKNTSLIAVTHISNVTGTVNDIKAIGKIAKEAGIPFLVDSAQSAGARRIDVQENNIDMLAFPGHKGLLGPQGTGGLYIRKGLDVRPLTRGGTGSFSESLEQPARMPDRMESGTLNVPGLAGLAAGIKALQDIGMEQIDRKERLLRERLYKGLSEIEGVKIYAPAIGRDAGCVVSFTLDEMEPSDIAMVLDEAFGIAVRAGLHCAPYAHKTIGTLDAGGTVRVSPNWFTEESDIDALIEAVRAIKEETI